MYDDLWGRAESKLGYAEFHLLKMGDSLQLPRNTAHNVAVQSSGAILDTGWQRAFWAYFDAFLLEARSVPLIIEACFGADRVGRVMKPWFDALPTPEQDRRRMFRIKFRITRNSFRDLPLTNARDISVHRAGTAPAKVTITGLFGVTYTGGPTELVPISETRQMPADLAWMERPAPVHPMWTDFTIDGRSLFDECHEYLKAANNAIQEGKPIAVDVHAGAPLTPPPG